MSAHRCLPGAVAVAVLLAMPAIASAQDKSSERTSRSAPYAAELRQLLESMQLTNVAARNGDSFVGAMYIPGQQLLVVSGKFSSDERIRYLIAMKEYSDAYVDLNGASERDTRVLIADLGANGLMFDRQKDQPFDYVDVGGKSVQFDGQWGGRDRLSRDEYAKAWQQHDEEYAEMLQALIGVLKKSS